MIDDAYTALDAIQRGQKLTAPGMEAWINAFKTVQWVVRTETGVRLTAAGREAFNQMTLERAPKSLGPSRTPDPAPQAPPPEAAALAEGPQARSSLG